MRAVLTGPSGRGRRTNSPMRWRLAAASLGYSSRKLTLELVQKSRSDQLEKKSPSNRREPTTQDQVLRFPLVQFCGAALTRRS